MAKEEPKESFLPAVTLRQAKAYVRDVVQAEAPIALMLWGQPGLGKTSAVKQASQELGVGFKSVLAASVDPTDVLGLPYIPPGEKRVHYAAPNVYPTEEVDGKKGIFFIDELSSTNPSQQGAWQNLILERSTHAFVFPKGWAIVCAGNRARDKAGAMVMSTALENRMTHLEVQADVDEFILYGSSAGIDPSILVFLREKPDMISTFDPRSGRSAYASPRSWEKVSDILKVWPDPEKARKPIEGTIGKAETHTFMAYLKLKDEMPKLEDVLSGKVDLKDIKNPSVVYFTIYALIGWVNQGKTAADKGQERVNRVVSIIHNLPDEWSVLLISSLWMTVPSQIRNSKGWDALSKKYMKYLT